MTDTIHTPASHYPIALNTYAAWYVDNIDSRAPLSRKYRFAHAMVGEALRLGWIPSEVYQWLHGCGCLTRTGLYPVQPQPPTDATPTVS